MFNYPSQHPPSQSDELFFHSSQQPLEAGDRSELLTSSPVVTTKPSSSEWTAIWERAEPATIHNPYCQTKGIKSEAAVKGLRQLSDTDPLMLDDVEMYGSLVIPLRRPDGTLQAVQYIAPDGSTRTHGPMENAFYVVGTIEEDQPVYVCGGITAAWACWLETGHAAVVACGLERMATVANAVLEAHPGAQLVLVPDVRDEVEANTVAKKLGCAVAKMPTGKPMDYNAWDCWKDEGQPGAITLTEVLEKAAVAPTATVKAAEDEEHTPPAAPRLSEIELAVRFAKSCVDKLRWSPGMEWMVNAGKHWERDEHLKRFILVKSVCLSAAPEAEGEKKESIAKRLCSAATVRAVLSMARSEPNIVTPVAAWDAHPMLLNTPGDVFDLETGLPVSRAGLLFTQLSGVAPVSMPTPVWDKFLSEVFDNDVEMMEFIQRLAGYCLTGSVKEQKLFFMHGEGANGKSVLLEVLRAIAGKYGHNLPSEALMAAKNERHPTTLAALLGKRLAISSELEESGHWAEARIKQLTGDATLTARFMKKDEFTFNVTHKHVLAGNFKPRLKGDDHAMVRRMVLIPFNQRFTGSRRDDLLPEKLKAEYPGILMWAIAGARKWATGGLLIPSTVTDSSREYMEEQDDIQIWAGECCSVGEGLRAKFSELYESYSAWKKANGEIAGSGKFFSQRLERKFKKLPRTASGMFFAGLQLKSGYESKNYQAQYEAQTRGC